MAIVVVGVFPSRGQAQAAVNALHQANYRPAEVGIIAPQPRARAQTAGRRAQEEAFEWIPNHQTVEIGGIGPVLCAGELRNCPSAGTSSGGSVQDILCCIGIAPAHARWYDDQVRQGCELVLVHLEETTRISEAQTIMNRYGSRHLRIPEPGSPLATETVMPPPPSPEAIAEQVGRPHTSQNNSRPAPAAGPEGTTADETNPFLAGVTTVPTSRGAARVQEGYDVFTADGTFVGSIRDVSDECLHILTCSNLHVPTSRVQSVDQDRVVLNLRRDQFERGDWSSCNPALERSFEPGGPGVSGVPPREHEAGTSEAIEREE
jgi:hypothetical protein